MKKTFCSWLLLLASVMMGYAQYIPNNSQGYQLMPLFNPAFSGIESFTDAKLSYRYQWAGFGKNAPQFINLALNLRLKQPLDLYYNSTRMSNMSKARMRNVPAGKRMIHGFGVNIFQSTVGVIKSMGASVNYSIHYPITPKARIAFGLSSLIENRKLDLTQVTVRDPDEYYDYLLTSSTSQTDLNIRTGLLLYSDRFYFGLSYLPLVNIALSSSALAMEQPFYRGSVQAGYRFFVNDDLSIKPSVLGLVTMKNNVILDYNVKAYIQNKIFFGLSYRSIQSGVALLGFNINDTFTASYSYEMSIGQFQKFNDGSHELVLSARLKNLKRYVQYTW
jgi:type IX secretion system PorP/SprF family membrane protein